MTTKAESKAKPVARAATAKSRTPSAVSKTKAVAPVKAEAKEKKPHEKEKPKKIKMVQDSFTIPEDEYAKLAELKEKCIHAGFSVKKGELLRAGLQCLSKLSATALVKAVGQVETIKTGRPAKG